MAEDLRMALQELLRNAELNGDVDFLRQGVRVFGPGGKGTWRWRSTWAPSAQLAPFEQRGLTE